MTALSPQADDLRPALFLVRKLGGMPMWSVPVVYVTDEGSSRVVIRSSFQAVQALTCWPCPEIMAPARQACLQAVDGSLDHEAARKAFISCAALAGRLRAL
nr:DUF982 domain-containing protein [Cereibacter sphaeroides f. sp. denitrificans]